uniref:Transposase IS204/IS1001/IS1096/IS1165 DDE domain-containing protein n=1 Tax=Candidatus Methanophagaceae archaeon ANME-1 ERB6 TaxID=2759912 RepID=A0A7G9YUX1_9EURY|nr:hypothetical protein PFGANNDM_00040 [Methanosarcinales archaeon ANME-1 ERB6]
MDDKKLMKITLGIPSPWFVKSVELNTSEERMDIYLDFIKGSEFACPICNKPCKIHDTKDRSWRHLPLFHYESYIHARVPRTKCEEHGTKIVDIPWSRHDTGFTSLFEADIVALCKEMPVASVAERAKIHEESAWRILAYHVNEALEHVDLLQLDTIGVDEIAVKKGHKYITLFYDIKTAKVIHIEVGKGKDTIKKFKDTISKKINPEQIKYIAMDMSPAFISGASEYFPTAKIVFDKFHVICMMNDTIDDIRRKEYKTNKTLGKTRFIWLKNPENLSDKEKKKLHSMKDLDIKTAKAYQFKLALQRLWRVKDLAAARNYLNKWYFWAAHSKIEEIVKLAVTVHKHSYGILEAIRTGLDNSVAEGLNNKIKTVVKRSYGFKTVKYRNTMIYLAAGKLELSSGLPTQC